MNALSLVHGVLAATVKKGSICVDATAGRGYDTAFLCDLCAPNGRVIAFDIQQCALDSTHHLLKQYELEAELVLDSHANMLKYVAPDSVDCIVFNLGYLPKGDHRINTRADSSKAAILAGLEALKSGGLMCLSIYYGGDSGYEERDDLLPWLKTLDDSKYQVIVASFHNWENDPPIPVFITKN